jgi:hypothetical protein
LVGVITVTAPPQYPPENVNCYTGEAGIAPMTTDKPTDDSGMRFGAKCERGKALPESMGSVQLPYAVRAGVVIDIHEVASGLHRDCLCPACGAYLVAKKGAKVRHHFAHYQSGCTAAGETLLHLAAKQVLEKAKRIVLPSVVLHFSSNKAPWILSPAKAVPIDEVRLESKVGNEVPDVIVIAANRRLAIEVTVTHKTSEEKVERLKRAGYSVLEVDLSAQSRFIVLDELQRLVVEGIENKKWRSNRLADRVRADLTRVSQRKRHVRRGLALHVDGCPLPARVWRGKPYANVIDDCLCCSHCLSAGLSAGEDGDTLLCLAASGVSSYEEWAARQRGPAQVPTQDDAP